MQRIYISLCLIVILIGIGCDPKEQRDASTEGKLRVVTTIGMITDIVKNVGGERVNVVGMMGPWGRPATSINRRLRMSKGSVLHT